MAESVDNKAPLTQYKISPEETNLIKEWSDNFNAYTLKVPATYKDEDTTLNVIPYFAFANRGECDMYVYINKK